MYDLEAARESQLVNWLVPDVLEVIVTCADYTQWAYWPHLPELVLSLEGLMLTDLLEDSEHEFLIQLDIID